MTQESTEDLTTEIIKNSKEIMTLLKRDNIKISEIDNYHLYPIADNDTPKLSADRLEYSLSNALFTYRLLDSEIIKEIYDDIEIQTNEEKEIEDSETVIEGKILNQLIQQIPIENIPQSNFRIKRTTGTNYNGYCTRNN